MSQRGALMTAREIRRLNQREQLTYYRRLPRDFQIEIYDLLMPEVQLEIQRGKLRNITTEAINLIHSEQFKDLPRLRPKLTKSKDAFIRLSENPSIISNGAQKTITRNNIQNSKDTFNLIDRSLKEHHLDVNGVPLTYNSARGVGKSSRKKRSKRSNKIKKSKESKKTKRRRIPSLVKR